MRTLRLFCFIGLAAAGGVSDVPSITSCDLVAPAHAGKRITLSARLLFTMHGAYILGDSCTSRGQHGAALLFPGKKGAPPVIFELDASALSRLQPFFRTTGGQSVACAILSGQVFYKKGFQLQHFGEITIGNGFGENGRMQTGFVLQSVENIHSCN